jgi:hypothetical protein
MKKVDSFKSLEQLEKDYWDNPEYNSYVVTTCYNMRKKPLNEVTVEELRLVIGQGFSLDYLIPLAIGILQTNILAEGDFYEGDLLSNVVSDKTFDYWRKEMKQWTTMVELLNQNKETIDNSSLATMKGFREKLESFKKINS